MKNLRQLFVVIFFMIATLTYAQENISPYFKLSNIDDLEAQVENIKTALTKHGFEIIGEYHPERNDKLYVIAYTSEELKNICLKFEDRGLHAAALKIGFVKKDGSFELSMTNPEYQFRGYLVDGFEKYESELLSIASKAKAALKKFADGYTPFGGEENKEKLYKYHYKIMMPYFTSPIELNEFTSFEDGLKLIQKNLKAKKGKTEKVYEIINKGHQVAVFGVALYDEEEGEKRFLPIIGEENIAAMPYDIILQGNKAYMLHGRFRFAFHWPELSMGTFMKIMSSPKDVKRFLQGLTE